MSGSDADPPLAPRDLPQKLLLPGLRLCPQYVLHEVNGVVPIHLYEVYECIFLGHGVVLFLGPVGGGVGLWIFVCRGWGGCTRSRPRSFGGPGGLCGHGLAGVDHHGRARIARSAMQPYST